ncbi:hypothetical protein FSP39_023581 [Pinctada imbricata]|uniref:Protein arginine N-methyltransferase n=1 Tax=Pinctada imbricata TaxID=66713 RepID=A0AA88Y0G7_PINIB|nr:hypothetical protein FSP39_023581 [Pinctada imbricata]
MAAPTCSARVYSGISTFVKSVDQVLNISKEMSTFVSTVNPVTGKTDWVLQDDKYDYHQEIARSAYADMLHDTERNQKYYKALELAIKIKRGQGHKVHVLDIGTGTGLLSMMAARVGADSITACEAFTPMAECARGIIKDNGYENKIRLIPKRSTDVTVGEGGDMPHRANILVTEVFDTELIGEGAIGTYTHAHTHLLEEDCIVVPSLAFMYVQPISSDFIRRWKEVLPIKVSDDKVITFPKEISECAGAPSLHDLQMDQLPQDKFDIICDPVQVFSFDFTGKSPLPKDEKSVVSVMSRINGQVDGIFMWWELRMDTVGDIMLSCAPGWAHPNIQELQWRDHWMQAVYYPSIPLKVSKGEEVQVISNHDEYSLWFDVQKSSDEDQAPSSGPACTCGIHLTYSRSRLGMLNDPVRRNTYKSVLSKNVQRRRGKSKCLVYSNGSLLPLTAAYTGYDKVYMIEPHPMCRNAVKSFVKENKLEDLVTLINKDADQISQTDLNENKLDLVIGEPFFESSVLPWHHIAFWYGAEQLTNHMADQASVLPCSVTIKALAVEFIDLWKIRAPVGLCEGFDISRFDRLIENSSDIADAIIEPQPLWEYPCIARSRPASVLDMTYTQFCSQQQVQKDTKLEINSLEGKCNGVALWAEYDFGDEHFITTGPTTLPRLGEKIEWDFYSKQGVYLLKKDILCCDSTLDAAASLKIYVSFLKETGDFNFKFDCMR